MSQEALLEAVRPVPGRYNLLSAVTTVTDGDAEAMRWAGPGFIFEPELCAAGGVLAIDCLGHTGAMATSAEPTSVTGSPFLVVGFDKCSTFGFEAREYAARARRQLEANQSFLIARELWSGAVTGSPSSITTPKNRQLAHASATTITSGPVTPQAALAGLDQSLAVCGMNRRGLIHVRPQLLPYLADVMAIRRDGAVWLTPLDNIVVADGGYSGSAPSTPATNPTTSQFMYATDWLEVHLGPVMDLGGPDVTGIDRTVNDVYAFAVRPAMVLWNHCCHLAAEVDTDALGSNPA